MTIKRTMLRRACTTVLAVPLVSAPFLLPASAHGTHPVPRPPVLTVGQSWLFTVGAQVDKAAPTRSGILDLSAFHRQVPVVLAWSGRSPVGIDHYDLYRHNPVGTGLLPVLTGTHRTSYAMVHTDVHGAVGPITRTLYPTFTLVATDRLGRSTVATGVRRSPVHYEQQNGVTWTEGPGAGGTFGTPVTGRGWRTLAGRDYDGGTVVTTARRGATVRLPLRTDHTQQVALEMTTGPRLGAVEVRIDGHRVGVVDTWAPRTRARVLVAQYTLKAGPHSVTLVNLGLHHRPAVQLDGVFVSD